MKDILFVFPKFLLLSSRSPHALTSAQSKREFLYIRASDEVLKEERRRVMDRQGRVASINDAEVELTALTRERMLHSIIDRIYASEEDMNP